MSQNFSPGQFCGANWIQTGAQAAFLEIRGHNLDVSVMLFDVSNTGNVGGRSRMAGLLDAAGTINTFLDLDQPLYAQGVNVQPGVRGLAEFGVSLTRQIQIPSIIEKLHFATTVDQALEASFDAKMDARSGVLVFPPV